MINVCKKCNSLLNIYNTLHFFYQPLLERLSYSNYDIQSVFQSLSNFGIVVVIITNSISFPIIIIPSITAKSTFYFCFYQSSDSDFDLSYNHLQTNLPYFSFYKPFTNHLQSIYKPFYKPFFSTIYKPTYLTFLFTNHLQTFTNHLQTFLQTIFSTIYKPTYLTFPFSSEFDF